MATTTPTWDETTEITPSWDETTPVEEPAAPSEASQPASQSLSEWTPTIGDRLKMAADELGQQQPFKTIGEIPETARKLGQSVVDFAKASIGKNPDHPLPPSPLSSIEVPSGAELTRDTGLPPVVTETASAIDKTVMGLASFVTSPQGAEQMATYGVPILKLPMAAKWISDMVKGGYLNIVDAVDAFKKGDTQRLRDNIIGATANFEGALGVGGGEVKSLKDYFGKLSDLETVAPPASREAPAPMTGRDALEQIPAAAPILTGASLYPLPKGAQPPTPESEAQNAERIRENQGQLRATGEVGGIGEEVGRDDLEQTPPVKPEPVVAGEKAPQEVKPVDYSTIGKDMGFSFDGTHEYPGVKPLLSFTFTDVPKSDPAYGATFNLPIDATPEQILGRAKSVAEDFRGKAIPQPSGESKNAPIAESVATPTAASGKPSGFNPPPMPEKFNSLEDVIKYRNDYRDSEISFYKSLGFSDKEAQKMFRASDGRSNLDVSKLEDKLSPENREKLDAFSTGEGSEMYQWDRQYDPEELTYETDKSELARNVVQNLSRESAPTDFGDKLLHAVVALRKLKENGGTWSDVARELDKHTTRNSSSQGDKIEAFKSYAEKIKAFANQQGIELPQGELGAKMGAATPLKQIAAAKPPAPEQVLPLKPFTERPELNSPEFFYTAAEQARYAELLKQHDDLVQQQAGASKKDAVKLAKGIDKASTEMTNIAAAPGNRWAQAKWDKQDVAKPAQVESAKAETTGEMSGPGSPSGKQGPDTGPGWVEGSGGDVYGIAQRVREARTKAGQSALPANGQGVSAEAAVEWGRDLKRNGADPEKAMQGFEKTKATSFDLIALARAHGEDLAQSARQVESTFGTDSTAYRTAQKALSDWDARSKAIQTEWHKQGMAQQGETDLDTGSFTGISRAFKDVTGEDLPKYLEPKAKGIAKGVSDADKAVEPAKVSLQAAIDNLTETGKPRYSDTIIKIAEKIVSSLDKRADAARARIRARAFTFSANIDPTVLRDVAEIGASHIAHWGLDFAKWSKVMVDEFGDKINPHLKTIFDASQKLVDAEGDRHGSNAESVKKAVKKTGGTKAPTDLVEQQKLFQDYESGKPMTPIQVKTLWTRAKSEYIDKGGTDKGDTVHKLAEDLGIDAKDVLKGLSQTKQVKRIADDVWQKQRQARLLKQAAKRWIEHSQETWLQKALPATAKTMFSMKVGGHGLVAMGTHASLVAATHPIVFGDNFGKMYRLVASPEYFEMQKSSLARRPNHTIAQRNGLVNDMNKMEDFNDPQLAQGFPKMAAWFKAQLDRVHLGKLVGMGTRGYSVLKILRQDLFDHEWDKLSESQKSDSMAKAIADSVNHMTGVTKAGAGQLGRAASYALFAPKLEASRVAVMVSDPLRAANSLVKMDSMTDAEKWFAKNQFKEKAKIAAVGFGLLLANQQLNTLFGDKKKLNGVPAFLGGGGWNPMESDFMKFRVAGMNFAWGSPFLTMARLPLRLYQIGAGSGGKTKYLIYPDESMYKTAGSYLRTQASPFLSPIISVITKGDYQDRPLPQIPGYGPPPPVPKRLAKQGVKPYTWPEFLSDIILPIPVEQGMNDIWHSHELSTKPEQDHALTKAFITGIIMAGTGGRLSDDWNKEQATAPPIKPASIFSE